MKKFIYVLVILLGITLVSCTDETKDSSNSSNGKCQTTQCTATTQKGERCKNKVAGCDTRCYLHR